MPKSQETELLPPSGALEKHRGSEVMTTADQLLTVIERAASNKEIDVDKMDKLLQMQERILAKQAEQQFNEAMREVQSEVPRILRDAVNPSTNSKYTRLESLLKIIVPIYTGHGFSISFGTADCPIPAHYRITAIISHKGGHSRPAQCDIPIDDKGMKGMQNKTATHGFGSTMSYGRRYLTLLVFNIALVNEDDDAKGQQKPSTSARVVTPALRARFFEASKPWSQQLHAMSIDLGWVMPDEALDKLSDDHIPTTKGEFSKLQAQVEAHK